MKNSRHLAGIVTLFFSLALGCSSGSQTIGESGTGGVPIGASTAIGGGAPTGGAATTKATGPQGGTTNEAGNSATGGVGITVCSPGITQICWGPGQCAGAQSCNLTGTAWGICECGTASGGASSVAASTALGGATTVGGTSSIGGTSTAGTKETGGVVATGGTNTTGGVAATGGTKATGGTNATGGIAATGGTNSTGGANATGGIAATGGTKATGGIAATGGTIGTGGAGATTGGTNVKQSDAGTSGNCSSDNLTYSIKDIAQLSHEVCIVTMGDLNQDNRPDIVISPFAASQDLYIAAEITQGQDQFAPVAYYNTEANGRTGSLATIGDVNGDGHADIATVNYEADYSGGSLSLFWGDGTGAFSFGSTVPTSVVDVNPTTVSIGDFNGDGRPDLVTTNQNGNDSVRVLFQQAQVGTFAVSQTFYIGDNHNGSAVADLDNDGDLDFVAVAGFAGTASFINNGTGHFTGPNMILAGSNQMIALADFNVDGYVNIAIRGPGTLQIFLNQGNAVFKQGPSYSVPQVQNNMLHLVAGDIDQNGVPDLALASGASDVDLMFGNGDGTFKPAVAITTEGTDWLAIGNVIGDAHPDVVFVTRNTYKLQAIQPSCATQ